MKAVRIHAYGGVDQLRYEDGDEPALRREDDVIVKLKAAAVNRIDLARAGAACVDSFPRVLGADGVNEPPRQRSFADRRRRREGN